MSANNPHLDRHALFTKRVEGNILLSLLVFLPLLYRHLNIIRWTLPHLTVQLQHCRPHIQHLFRSLHFHNLFRGRGHNWGAGLASLRVAVFAAVSFAFFTQTGRSLDGFHTVNALVAVIPIKSVWVNVRRKRRQNLACKTVIHGCSVKSVCSVCDTGLNMVKGKCIKVISSKLVQDGWKVFQEIARV